MFDIKQDQNIILPNLSPDIYYASSRIGSSRLKAFTDSPLAFKNFKSKKDTSSMKFGRAYHAYLEGEKAFNDSFFVLPDGVTMAHKKGKLLKKANADKQHISSEKMSEIIEMSDALYANPDASRLLDFEFVPEVSVLWTQTVDVYDNPYRLKCQGRIDRLAIDEDGNRCMLDFKTCASADLALVMRSMHTYKYWLQYAHYNSGYKHCLDIDIPMYFVFQETQSPYDVCVVKLSDEACIEAKLRYTEIMYVLAECHVSGEFKGRHSGIFEWNFLETRAI